jgi:hypothetical protein
VGREGKANKILLAVEVDRVDGVKMMKNSWLKLADISAVCKAWILLDYKSGITDKSKRLKDYNDYLRGVARELRLFLQKYGNVPNAAVKLFYKTPDLLRERSVP